MQDGTVDPGRDRLRQGANLVAVLVSFGANTWSNVAPVGGMTVGDIANAFFTQVLVLPANYAFAIWGLIYVGLGAFAIYQFRTDQAANPRLRRLGYLLPLAALFQSVWVFTFEARQFWISCGLMMGILVCLMLIYHRLRSPQERPSRVEKWLVDRPFSLYLGWISVATVVNWAVTFYSVSWTGTPLTPVVWAVVMMAIAAGIAGFLTVRYGDVTYNLVTIWALVAIALRHGDTPVVPLTAGGLAVVLGILAAVSPRLRQSTPA